MRGRPGSFDIVLSADTLVYFGALEDIVTAASGALRPDGLLIFTLEHAVLGNATLDYRLELHGRYSHCRGYVERLLIGAGLVAVIAQDELRMESGAPVAGLVIRAMKGSVLPIPPCCS